MMAKHMKITNLKQFEEFLKSRIPSREALFVGDIGIKRAKYFMRLIGDPQNKIKVIHIAGTSGKGSTAYLTSHILQSQGFKIGLSISPHVFDIRERMQIDNNLPSEKLILKHFNQILPIILKMEKSKYGSPTFFEINVGLAFYMFAKENIDYAIMETGLGGRLDATNAATSKNKICLITKIGLDHTEILGNKISEIANEKAGIIQGENTVISHHSSVTALKVIKDICEKQNADLEVISKKNYSIISSTPLKTVFDFYFQSNIIPSKAQNQELTHTKCKPSKTLKQVRDNNTLYLKNIKLGLIGKHQAENCSLALSCLAILSLRDNFTIDKKLLRSTLRNITIPGRMEMLKINGQTFILDGAHNPQKMKTFIENLSFIYPNQKFVFVAAFKKGKDWKKMLEKIIPTAEKIYLSGFSLSNQDNLHSSIDNQEISKFLLQKNFHNFETIQHSNILENVRMLSVDNKKPIIITGSLYFIGFIVAHI
ncbi:MAG: hypothetical protein ACD_5C00267G0001 [uncultured bacterium]|nr:MAG: hypothetical protein ACD_5C00267G0001 [uncultured bacterium]